MVALYGAENAPPPWSTFTVANEIQEGNMHIVQKVFEGAFEVSTATLPNVPRLLTEWRRSSMLYTLLLLPKAR